MRRAFAMPIVILLALVVGIMAAVLLERQGAQSYTVRHELNGYRDHHFSRGVREVVGQWTDTLSGQPLEKMIQDDGHVLDIMAADGGSLSVYMFDGQGSVLTDPAGLLEQDRTDAGGIYEALQPLASIPPDPSWFRSVGPVKVCAASAPSEVLEAIATYALDGGRNGKRFAESLVKARTAGELTQADIQTAESAADMTAEQRQVADRLLVLKPELWNMVIDVYKQGERDPTVRYGGRFSPPDKQGGSRNQSLQTLGKFLSWEELPIHDDQAP